MLRSWMLVPSPDEGGPTDASPVSERLRSGALTADDDELADIGVRGLPLGRALGDLEDDFFRTGESVSFADVDRAAERHRLSAVDHAELVERALAAGYLVQIGSRKVEASSNSRGTPLASDYLDSFTLLMRDVIQYPLLDARQEVELARAIEAGNRATSERAGGGDTAAIDQLIERGLAAKRRLVACNIRLVINNARAFRGQGLDMADLVQAGTLGLIRAAEKFDWRLGFKFSTYATAWIRQSIARQLADTGRLVRLPVHVVERVHRVQREARKLELQLGREPKVPELAEALGWEAAEIAFLRDVAQDPLSLDAPLGSADAVVADFIPSVATDTETVAISSIVAADVRKALDMLTPQQRDVLILRYGLDGTRPRTLEEIGKHYSVTRERIRQIERVAKGRLERVLLGCGYGPE